jgi:DNA-binding MarR family transcriptional regulator
VHERVLRGAIVFELTAASRYAEELSARALRAAGVDPAEYGFLSIIGTLQPVTRADISRATGFRRTTLRDALRPVVERGHVRETPHPRDRRATLLELTPAGQAVFDRGLPAFHTVLSALDREVGGQLAGLEESVWTVRTALERLVRDGALGAPRTA